MRATRIVDHEKWKAEVLLTPGAVAIGYTKGFFPPGAIRRQGRVRVSLGIAMGCVKREDTVPLPLEPIDTLIPLATEE